MAIIRWENPPPPHQGANASKRARRPDVLEEQRFGDAGGLAGQIKAGRLAAFRPGGWFEAQTRTIGDLYRVYARYVGEGGA